MLHARASLPAIPPVTSDGVAPDSTPSRVPSWVNLISLNNSASMQANTEKETQYILSLYTAVQLVKNGRIANANLNLHYNCNSSTHTIKASMGLELVWNLLSESNRCHVTSYSYHQSTVLPQITSNNMLTACAWITQAFQTKLSITRRTMVICYSCINLFQEQHSGEFGSLTWMVWESAIHTIYIWKEYNSLGLKVFGEGLWGWGMGWGE